MTVRQLNVSTGKVTTRPYTKKELDAIAASQPSAKDVKASEDAERKSVLKEEAIDELIQASTGAKATAYKKL